MGIARLFPLDLKELQHASISLSDYETTMLNGFYPAHFDREVPPRLFYPSYTASYIERDVSGLISSSNLNTFRRFLQICATYASQLINYSAIARDVGVSVPTIQSWFSVLEQSYLIFRLSPYYRNFNKRLLKSPKLYFYDTGLLCYLLNIQNPRDLMNYYQLGALFENLVIADYMKRSYHHGIEPKYYFYRDSNQLEIDLIEETAQGYNLIEVKATRTYKSKLLKNLHLFEKFSDRPVRKVLVYGGDESFEVEGGEVVGWRG